MQNLTLSKFKEYIASLFQVKLLVNSSENVKLLLNQYNLTPAEFLRPFGQTPHEHKLMIKTLNAKLKNASEFSLNFYDLEEFQTPSKQKIDDIIKEVILTNSPEISFNKFNSFKTPEEAERHLNENRTLWFDKAFDALNDFTRFSHDLNFLDQPLAVINMVSCNQIDEILGLMTETNKFLNSNNLLDVRKFIFVLFDNEKDTIENARFIAKNIETEFNIEVNLLPMNSPQSNYQDLWYKHVHRKYFLPNNNKDPLTKYGFPLSENDKKNINEIFVYKIMKFIIPSIESKITSLDAHITLNKKGIKNTVKNFFKKTEKNENPNTYQMNMAEAATRNLADLLFLIQDYDQALQIYRLSANDFKNKSNKHYANCLEMSIYSTILSETQLSKKEIDTLFENFEQTFTLFASSQENLKFAGRCLAFQILAFFLYGKFNKDSIKFIIDSCHLLKDFCPLIYPLFLEQYSTLNLKLKPVRSRKYCLNLLFAGNKFSQFTLKKNALRCFLITNNYYTSAKWHILNEYSYLQTARFFFDIKDYYQSVIYQKLAINEAKSLDSVDKHNNIVNEFARILKAIDIERKNNGISEELFMKIFDESDNIALPKLSARKIDIFLDSDNQFMINIAEKHVLKSYIDDYMLKSNENSNNQEETIKWFDLLEKINGNCNKDQTCQVSMLSSLREKNNFRLFDCRFLEEKSQLFNKKERFSYVGETIYIAVEFDNPLKILLDLKNIRALYEFESVSGLIEKNLNDRSTHENVHNSECLEISIEKLQISQLSNGNQCFLRVIPKIPGKLKLIGLEWSLLKMKSRYFFDFQGKKLKDGANYDKNLKNIFEILPRTSILLINIENFEENIYFGEIKNLRFLLKNTGPHRIKRIFIATSHPHFFGFSCKRIEDGEIEAGGSKMITLAVRGSFLQKTEIKVLFKYILEENIHKTVRIVLPVRVLPSFNFAAHAYQVSNDYIVNLQIENYLNNNSFKSNQPFDLLEDIPNERSFDFSIKGLFILSRNWDFTSLQTHLAISPPSESSSNTLLFHVKKNNSGAEKMTLISLHDNEIDEIPENFVMTGNSPKFVGKLEKFTLETNSHKCLNLGQMDQEELERVANELCNFANEDNFLLYSKYWFFDFDFFHSELMSLAVFWKFRKPNGDIANGMISVSKILMNKHLLNNLVNKSSIFDINPLKIEISAQNRIQHDFLQNPICKFPVKITIKNHAFPQEVSFKLEVINSDEPLQSKSDFTYPFYIWEGVTEKDFINIQPDKQEIFNVNVCVFEKGCYDLSRIRITFFRNKLNKTMLAPVSLKSLMGVDYIETKNYFLQSQESFVNIV